MYIFLFLIYFYFITLTFLCIIVYSLLKTKYLFIHELTTTTVNNNINFEKEISKKRIGQKNIFFI